MAKESDRAVTDDEAPKTRRRARASQSRTPGSKPRESRSGAKTSRSRAAKSPPNRVDPSWIHETIARWILKLLKSQSVSAGVPLDVGDISSPEPEPGEAGATDGLPNTGTEPVEILSRVLAHLGHRVPGVKKIEKRLEGQDKSSGILADLGALGVQIYRRNEEVIQESAEALYQARKLSKDPNQGTIPGFPEEHPQNGDMRTHPQQ